MAVTDTLPFIRRIRCRDYLCHLRWHAERYAETQTSAIFNDIRRFVEMYNEELEFIPLNKRDNLVPLAVSQFTSGQKNDDVYMSVSAVTAAAA